VQVTEIDPVAVAAVDTRPAPNWEVKAILVAPIVQEARMVIDTGSVPVAVPAWAIGSADIHDRMAARPMIAERMRLRRAHPIRAEQMPECSPGFMFSIVISFV
jgi:hypothetical protein